MTRFAPSRRRVRDDDALLDSLADRETPAAGSDGAVRLLADLAVAADAASPGVGRRAREGSRFVATSERSARPSLAWAAAAAAAVVVAVALGTVAPPSAPRPSPTAQVTQVPPVSLTRARELIVAAASLLRPTGPLVASAARDRARALLGEARTELERARSAGEGQPAERDEVERLLSLAETTVNESSHDLEGRDGETGVPSPGPTASDEDEQHSETDGPDEGTLTPGGDESPSHDN